MEFADSFQHHVLRRFQDACQRSIVYRQALAAQDPEPVSCAPQEHTLPQSGTIPLSGLSEGVVDAAAS
jgi:hypothetical protein